MSVDAGCEPICIAGGVYLLADTVCDLVKVGMSESSVEKRVAALGTASPHPLELLAVVRTLDPAGLEAALHLELHALHVRGEWYRWSADASAVVERTVASHFSALGDGYVEVTPTGIAKGVTLHDIMRQTRHKSERVAMTYIRPATVFVRNPTDGLGDEE